MFGCIIFNGQFYVIYYDTSGCLHCFYNERHAGVLWQVDLDSYMKVCYAMV